MWSINTSNEGIKESHNWKKTKLVSSDQLWFFNQYSLPEVTVEKSSKDNAEKNVTQMMT